MADDAKPAGDYEFKPGQELAWFVAVALITTLAQYMIEFKPETITDWRTYAVAIAGALVRAVGGAVSAWLAKKAITS